MDRAPVRPHQESDEPYSRRDEHQDTQRLLVDEDEHIE
jgi:hypothetical protein